MDDIHIQKLNFVYLHSDMLKFPYISFQANPAAPSKRPPLGALLNTATVPAATTKQQQLVKTLEIKLVQKSPLYPKWPPLNLLTFPSSQITFPHTN